MKNWHSDETFHADLEVQRARLCTKANRANIAKFLIENAPNSIG